MAPGVGGGAWAAAGVGGGSCGYGRGCGAGDLGRWRCGSRPAGSAPPGGALGRRLGRRGWPGVPAGGAAGGAWAGGWPACGCCGLRGGIAWTTGRMYSRAVCPRLRASLLSLPGTVITRLSPSMTTSEPDTPSPLTRSLMICWAWFSASRVGADPSGVRAVSVTRVPPCRSMPSLGLACLSPVRKTSR